MAFKVLIRKDSYTRDNIPKIGIRSQHVGFNLAFVKQADLNNYSKVQYFVDEEDFRLGFKFYVSSNDKNTYSLFSDNKSGRTKAASAWQLIKEYPFIKKISEFDSPMERQFIVEKDKVDKSMWVAVLCPAFEHRVSRGSDIRNSSGIYRYVREGGEVIYIGRGKIGARLKSPERATWEFDFIEYSIVGNESNQKKWESVWLDKYVRKHGKLPYYNKVSGNKLSVN